MNNGRQLMYAWIQYSGDNNDRLPDNYGILETTAEIANGTFRSWVNNIMHWSFGSPADLYNMTNIYGVINSPFGPYVAKNLHVYQCPSDTMVNGTMIKYGIYQRPRSYSMSSYMGAYNPTWTLTRNQFWPYTQFLKLTRIKNPSQLYATLEEHPNSINDGFFDNSADSTPGDINRWNDLPASYHSGGCTFSFADGHSEVHRWFSKICTILPETTSDGFPVHYFTEDPGNAYKDFTWVAAHSSY